MALRTDEIQLRVLIDGSPARKELAELAVQESKLVDQLRQVKRGSEEAKTALADLANVRGRQEVLRKEIGLVGLSARELGAELKKAQTAYAAAPKGTEQWVQAKLRLDEVKAAVKGVRDEATIQGEAWEKVRGQYRLATMNLHQLTLEQRRLKAEMDLPDQTVERTRQLQRELAGVEGRITSLRSGLGPFGRLWADVKTQVAGAVAVLGSFLAGGAIIGGIRNLVTGSAKLSDELANVRKATGQTEEQVRRLNKEFGEINTRTSNSGLREIATGLGQIGEAATKANVEAIDRIVLALGDEFGTDGKAITNAISVLRNNLDDLKTGDYATDVTHIGNALNELGAQGLATAPVITDILNRISGQGRALGVTSGQLFGMAAGFQELGINTERGSTAFIKALQKMAAEPEKFAAIVRAAGGDAQAFVQLINTDIQEALLQFAVATRKVGDSNTEFAGILKDLDTDGAGVSELLSKLATNTDLVREKTDLATKSLKESSSITEEARIRNENLAGQLEQLGKQFNRLFTSDTVVGWVRGSVEALTSFVGWVQRTKDEILFVAKVLGNAIVAWASYRLAVVAVEAGTRILTAATTAYTTVKALFTGQVKLATVAQNAFNAAVRANPIALAISLISSAASLFMSFGDEVESATEKQLAATEAARLENEQRAESIRLLNEEIAARKRVDQVRDQLRTDPAKVSLNDLRDAAQSLRSELDELSTSSLDMGKIWERIVNSEQFKNMPTVSTILFGDVDEATAKSNAEKNVATYKQFLIEELDKLDAEIKRRATRVRPDAPSDAKDNGQLERMRDQVKQWRNQLLLDALSSDEREVAQVDQKYADLRAAIIANEKHTAADLLALDEAYAQARANAIEAGGEKRLEAERKVQEQLIQDRQLAEDAVWFQSLDSMDQEIAAQLQHMDELTANLEEGSEAMIRITEFTEKKIAQIKRNAAKKDLADRIALYDGIGQAAAGLSSFLTEVTVKGGQRDFQYTEFGRALALVQIATSAASAVAKAVDAAANEPFPLNIAGIATGVGAVLAAIGSAYAALNAAPPTPPPPGGLEEAGERAPRPDNVPLGEQGGIFDGPSHADGGLGVFDNRTGRQVAEVEGGEAWMVLSKAFTRNNANLIPALLAASKTGERISWLAPPPTLNTGGIAHAMRMEAGGMIGGRRTVRGTALVNMPTGGDDPMPAWAVRLEAQLKELNRTAANWPTRVKAITNLREDERDRAEYARLKAKNRVRRS